MSQKKTRARRERVEEMRAEQQRAVRRRRVIGAAAGVAVAVLVVAGVAYGVLSSQAEQAEPADQAAVVDGGAPPWDLPADPLPNIRAAGLNTGPMGTAEHYHAHLDIFVDGESVPVPANIGIEASGAMSALHTHDERGVIHIEAHTKGDEYTLGQVFTQWGVKLTESQIGSLKVEDGKTLTAYVNGKEHKGDPAAIVFKPHMQVALVYGKPDPSFTPPAEYEFQQGE